MRCVAGAENSGEDATNEETSDPGKLKKEDDGKGAQTMGRKERVQQEQANEQDVPRIDV